MLFTDVNELISWAEDLDVIHFLEVQDRIADLSAFDNDDNMPFEAEEESIQSHIRQFEDVQKLLKWSNASNLQNNKLVMERVKELSHVCKICENVFRAKKDLLEHTINKHGSKRFSCRKCGYISNPCRHEQNCTVPTLILRYFKCCDCHAKFPSARRLIRHSYVHRREKDEAPELQPTCKRPRQTAGPSSSTTTKNDMLAFGGETGSRSYTCKTCLHRFSTWKALYVHRMRHKHKGAGLKLQELPWNDGETPGQREDKFREVYGMNEPFTLEENISGPYGHGNVFDQPILITKRQDIHGKLRKQLETVDFKEYMLKNGVSSKWEPVFLTNVQINISRTNFPLES